MYLGVSRMSAHLDSVDSLSGEMAPCPSCVSQQGLCGRHKKGILPQLAQPFWYKLVGATVDKTAHEQVLETMSPEARRVYHRKRTKAARRAAMQQARQRSLAALAALAA